MNFAILLSGGVGSRAGTEIPKQYIEKNGKPVIAFSFEQISKSEKIDGIVIVVSAEWEDYVKKHCQTKKLLLVAEPGRNRQESILHGLRKIKEYLSEKTKEESKEGHTVFVHDAARPYLTEEMILEYYKAYQDCDGVLPVLPMKDTVYFSEDGKTISSLLERQKIVAGQAPELFDFEKYLLANEKLSEEDLLKINGSTEPAMMAGMKIRMVPGAERNIKITTAEDVKRFLAGEE